MVKRRRNAARFFGESDLTEQTEIKTIGDKARHIERKRNDSTARPPFVALMRATSPVSSGESTHDQSEKYMLFQLFGGILHFCYSALNARALKLSFSAFFVKNASAL